MKDEEITAIAKQIWGENLGIGDGTSAPVGFVEGWCDVKPTSKIIAFARAIADLQKGERAVICKNCGAIYWGEVSQCDCAVGVETKWEEVKVIRSPETDLDEVQRRQ